MKKVLLTGGSGFIGRNIIDYFAADDRYEITAPSSRELDLIDEEAVTGYLAEHDFDIALHFAVYGDGIDKTKDGSQILNYNLRMFLNFEKNAHRFRRILYAGTGAEYDKRFPICSVTEEEEGRHIPTEQYGLMRYVTDRIIRKSDNMYSLKLFGIFGKYEPWHMRFISNCCCKAVKGLPISIRQNVYFDYLWIEDFLRILEWFMDETTVPEGHAYNVASGCRVDLYTIARMVIEVSEKQIPIYVCREGLGREYTADNRKLMRELGEFQFTPLKEAVAKLYRWYEEHEEQIDLYQLLYQ